MKTLDTLDFSSKIQKVVDLYESSYERCGGICVWRNFEAYDVDAVYISFINNTFNFEFEDYSMDEVKKLKVSVDNIKDILFDGDDKVKISILQLDNEDIIMIHCF